MTTVVAPRFPQSGPSCISQWPTWPPVHLPAPAPDCPIQVVALEVPAARADDRTRRFGTGWGTTLEEAAHNCLFEAAERFSGQYHGDERIVTCRAEALSGGAILPPQILLVSDRQYADRRRWNAAHPGSGEVPSRWRSRQIYWLAAKSIEGGAWLPARLCFLGFPKDRHLPAAGSSGLAAGMSLEDATVRAFLELVERDAVSIWWYGRLRRPLMESEALGEPVACAYARWSESRGRRLRLHDLTHDLGVPVVAAVSHDTAGGHIAFGFAAEATVAQAARHAVGELAQFECNVALVAAQAARAGAQGISPEARALLDWYRSAHLDQHPHLAGAAAPAIPHDAGLVVDFAFCRELCRRKGLQLFMIDQTRTSIGVPTARVVVPGLRPLEPRFAPGRLYDVPVALGWRRTPITESELNRTPAVF